MKTAERITTCNLSPLRLLLHLISIIFLLCTRAEQSRAADFPAQNAVVVEHVGAGSALAAAGLQSGDVLFAWQMTSGSSDSSNHSSVASPGRSRGEIKSVFDWVWLEQEQAPRGPLQLIGYRDGKELEITVAAGQWDAKVRPTLSEALLAALQRMQELIAQGQTAEAISYWSERSSSPEISQDLRIWMALRGAEIFEEQHNWKQAEKAFRSALSETETPSSQSVIWRAIGSLLEREDSLSSAESAYRSALTTCEAASGRGLSFARVLDDLGSVIQKQGRISEAAPMLTESLKIKDNLAPGALIAANSLLLLGTNATEQGDLKRASVQFEKALELYQKTAPRSLTVSHILNNIARVERERGNLEKATQVLLEALKLVEELTPDNLTSASILVNLGDLAYNKDDLRTAQDYFERSLTLLRKLAPNSTYLATATEGLGLVAEARGDVKLAEEINLQALRIRRQISPESLDVANSLLIQGAIAGRRGDVDAAADYYLDALRIAEKNTPKGKITGILLHNLGLEAFRRRDFNSSETYLRRALELQRQQSSANMDMARTLGTIALVARARGELAQAENLFKKALEMQNAVTPGSLESTNVLGNLGDLAFKKGDLEGARRFYQNALDIQSKLSPHSSGEAQALNALGKVAAKAGQKEVAFQYFERSLVEFEEQIGRLGGSQIEQAGFQANFADLYKEAIDFCVRNAKPEKAFHFLEQYRVRGFLSLLAERDLTLGDAPPALESARHSLAARYDSVQRQLSKVDSRALPTIESLNGELRKLRRDYEEVGEQIRRTTQSKKTPRDSQPLGSEELLPILEPEVVLLSYSVEGSSTHLFIVTSKGGLRVVTIPIAEVTLRNEIELFKSLIVGSTQPRGGNYHREVLAKAGEHLFDILIGPAVKDIEPRQRIIILNDGPLHVLPWGALTYRDPTERRYFYLAEWKSISIVPSATVYAQFADNRNSARSSPRSLNSPELTAFGDPSFPLPLAGSRDLTDFRLRAFAHKGFRFERLPASRDEVQQIGSVYPRSQVYMGEEATESRAKSISRNFRYIHFATHAVLDQQSPLDSAVVLSIPEKFEEGKDNGLLQAWEIFEQVRLDADLVVLSACESGLGKEMGGEGLIGLTRAFQYAGARSVMASLWKISDRTTAELMVRFYRHLKDGMPKDEALRAAQMELIRGPIRVRNEKGEEEEIDASAPYYWAAFQIYGDWQ